MSDDSKAVVRAKNEETFKALLKRYEPQIAAALPKHVTPERMLRMIRTCVNVNPDLMECSPLSVIAAIVQASQYGLDLHMLNQAWVIPRWNSKTNRKEAVFQIGYGGAIELAYRSERIKAVQPRAVYSNDAFSIEYTPELRFTHRIDTGGPRGELVGVYLYTKLFSDEVIVDWWTKKDIEEHRDRFGPKTKDGRIVGPWVSDFEAMALKTAVHLGTKWLPKSTELGMRLMEQSRIEAGQESPETVVLEISPEEAESVALQASTESKQQELKKRIAGKRQPSEQAGDRPVANLRAQEATEGGEPQGETTTPQPGTSDGSADAAEGTTEPPRPTTSAESPFLGRPKAGDPASPSAPPPQPRNFTDFPDPGDFQDGTFISVNGKTYRCSSELSAWQPVAEKPKFGEKPPPAASKVPKRSPDAGDFV